MTSNAAKQVFLGDSFEKATVYAGDITIELDERGDVTIHTNGNVTTLPGPQRKVGDIQPDRTVYAGISPDTHKPIYAMPRDMPVSMSWNQSAEGAPFLEAYGHNDWRMASPAELKTMFGEAAALGLETSPLSLHNWHWSSGVDPKNGQNAWVESNRGNGQYVWKGLTLSTRYVRG